MTEYLDLWVDERFASKMLHTAIVDYIDRNENNSTSPQIPDHFALDPQSDAVKQLVDFYRYCTFERHEAARTLLTAAQALLNLALQVSKRELAEIAILSLFLLCVAEQDNCLNPGDILKTLRPALTSGEDSQEDIYSYALLQIGDLVTSQIGHSRQDNLSALKSEWDYMVRIGSAPPASLARILLAAETNQWPSYIAAVCEAAWPEHSPSPIDQNAFRRSVQNMTRPVPVELLGRELYRMTSFLTANQDRGDSIMSAIFNTAATSSPNDGCPFSIEHPNTEHEPDLEQWRISPRGDIARSRMISVSRGNLNDMQAYQLIKLLSAVVTALLAFLTAA